MTRAAELESASIFLSGPMGSGKTTVGRALAERLGAPFVDLDARIEAEQGASVRAIFRDRGEPVFRAIEREAAARVASEPGTRVVALGGGTVTDTATRRMLLARGTLVTLHAPPEELARRVAGGDDRPLLASASDSTRVLATILEERAAAYAECHARIDTRGRDASAIADDIVRVARERPVAVALGERSYRVEIGSGVASRLGARLREAGVSGTTVVVGDENVEAPWAANARGYVEGAGLRAAPVTLAPGEQHKTIGSVERIWDAALEAGIDRHGAVVAVGGGVVGDLAAFAASTILRGIVLAQIPTSLLAMVDSSVGGKTGFDRAQGKNLIGSFHQPRTVLCDVDALSTLDRAERIAGLAEVVKSAWIDSEDAVAALERDADALLAGDAEATVRAVRMSVALKARIVAEDEHERGPRALLNLGHTLGHAIEAASGYTMRHGEAVARGMVAAVRVARTLGDARPDDERRMIALLTRLGLPTDPERYLDETALAFVGADKKRKGSDVRFVSPGAAGNVGLRMVAIAELKRIATGG
ncbi:3-dehydroquinate synthase [Sandaracinus amylolyticus]|uniref:3-dehydroquinate synthase n=1 Tax=Sandaracinus amylolyticus TaxID=927083 RepID=UPI001F0176C9|nr:3-dehydroquinate synthase [Sandaracinus amylolyticus]UJR79769.1 Shikimate kinase [Sandaracinus amylolyticus]